MNSLPTWRYRICLCLVSPILLIHCAWRGVQDGGMRYIKERFGYISPDQQSRIHIHAASVGEVITVLPLIEKLQAQHADLAFLVTTNTPTGAAVLQQRLGGNAKQAYLPIDFAGATQRFFSRTSLSDSWVVETEIWPWLYARAKQLGIPITLVNARLGHKSRGAVSQFFDATYTRALSDVHVLARSNDDAQRYIERGAHTDKVVTIGNLKLSYTPETQIPSALLTVPYVLAASTHDDEELRIAQAWLHTPNSGLLVIAPRHVERGARLFKSLNALQHDINPDLPPPAKRSLNQQPTADSKLYIADTLGELHHWYTHATAAFVGGSLIKRGGHNVLEPARANTLIIVGPHTFNFEQEVTSLQAVNAIAIAENAEEVVKLFLLAESNPQWAESLRNRATELINNECGVIDIYIESLQALMINKQR